MAPLEKIFGLARSIAAGGKRQVQGPAAPLARAPYLVPMAWPFHNGVNDLERKRAEAASAAGDFREVAELHRAIARNRGKVSNARRVRRRHISE